MTNEELIAQAREFLEQEIKLNQDRIEDFSSMGLETPYFKKLVRLAATHLAEMDEHYNNFVEGNYNLAESVEGWFCQGCYERNDSDTPCQKLLTKAKRLLGEDTK